MPKKFVSKKGEGNTQILFYQFLKNLSNQGKKLIQKKEGYVLWKWFRDVFSFLLEVYSYIKRFFERARGHMGYVFLGKFLIKKLIKLNKFAYFLLRFEVYIYSFFLYALYCIRVRLLITYNITYITWVTLNFHFEFVP